MSTPNTSGAGRGPRGPQPRPAAARPAAPRQAPQQRPAAAPAKGQPQRPAQRPAAAGQKQGLVRPAPKAKVRKARLLVSKVDVWSVLKLAFLLSVAMGIITVVAAVLLWMVFDLSGVFEHINSLIGNVLGNTGSAPAFNVKDAFSMGQVTSFAVIIAVVNVVLLSALSMVAAFIYNLASGLVGGISVTLTDD